MATPHALSIVLAGKDATGAAFRAVTQRIAGFTGAVANLKTALLGAAGVTGLGYFVKTQLEAADRIAKTADAVNLSTDAWQAYVYMADRAGISSEQLSSAMGSFTRQVAQMRTGAGTLAAHLRGTNTELYDQMQAARTAEEALSLYLREMGRTEDALERSALASAAFGEGVGIDMVRLVAGGEAGLTQLRQEFERYGRRIDESVLRKSEAAVDQITNLQYAIKQRLTAAVVELAPQIETLVGGWADWVVENDKFLVQDLPGHLKDIASSLRDMSGAVINFARSPEAQWMREYWELLAGAAIGAKAGGGLGAVIGAGAGGWWSAVKDLRKWWQTEQAGKPTGPEVLRFPIHDPQAPAPSSAPGPIGTLSPKSGKPGSMAGQAHTPEAIQDAYRSMYNSLGQEAEGYYNFQVGLLEQQRDAYLAVTQDQVMAHAWFTREVARLDQQTGRSQTAPSAEAIQAAYAAMYADLGHKADGYYAFQLQMLERQRDEFITLTQDQALAYSWFSAEKSRLDRHFVTETRTGLQELGGLLKDAFSGWASAYSRQLNDMLWEADFTFKGIAESFGRMVTQMIIQVQMAKAVTWAFGDAKGGGVIVGLLRGGGGAGKKGPGGAEGDDVVVILHGGGVVGKEGRPVSAPARLWDHAPRLHRGRLASDEYPAILQRGESVLTPAQMQALGRPAPPGPTQVRVEIHNESGQKLAITDNRATLDAQGLVVSLWLDAYHRNKGGLRAALGA